VSGGVIVGRRHAQIQHDGADKQHASADAQHASANAHNASAQKQHASADKLVTLGVALEADAVELNGEIETRTARSSPHMEASDGGTPALPKAIPS